MNHLINKNSIKEKGEIIFSLYNIYKPNKKNKTM